VAAGQGEGKCRLLHFSSKVIEVQRHTFFSDAVNICVRAENDPAPCKASFGVPEDKPSPEKENPGAFADATGAVDCTFKHSVYARGAGPLATHFWDRQSHSIEPLRELGAVRL
jgi:hypothetical protein